MSPSVDLNLKGLRVAAADGRCLLMLHELQVPGGGFLCLSGPSGAGKSTLLLALAGVAESMTGAIQWGEEELVSMSLSAREAFRRRRIGLVFQDFLLFEETDALTNATLAGAWLSSARRAAVEDTARCLLVRLGLDPDDPRPVAQYSGGERQRVAVVRALATNPSVLLADEPTASLDRHTADDLVEVLLELNRESGRTLIVASHDPALRKAADQVLDLSHGRDTNRRS